MKKRFLTTGKMLLAVALLTGMSGMGVTYSYWNADGSITSGFRTGKFSIIFSEPERADYAVSIVDGNGNTLEEMTADVLVNEDGKSAGIHFGDGLPIELLVEGNYIKIEFPLEPAADGTVTGIAAVEADLESEGELLEMTADSGELTIDGNPYEEQSVLEPFMIPLEFHVYRGTVEEPAELYGNIFLRMTDESVERVCGMPEMIALDEELLDGADSSDGIVTVTYGCDITFYMDQKEAGMDAEQEDGGLD